MSIVAFNKATWQTAVRRVSELDAKSAAKGLRHIISRFGTWAGLVYLAVASFIAFFVHFHIWPERWKLIPNEELPALAFVVGLLFVLSEQIKDYSSEHATVAERLEKSVDSLVQKVENLGSQLMPQLMLSECIQRLQDRLSTVPLRETVSIRHIALDMESAWLHVREKIFEPARKTRHNKINYRLLLLSGSINTPGNELPELQAEMKEMSERALLRLNKIQNYFAGAQSQFGQVSVEIRTYTSLPILHGISADKPIPVHYVAFCGWRGFVPSNYHWGEGHYYEIKERPDASTSMGDIVSMFDGCFQNLWNNGTKVYES